MADELPQPDGDCQDGKQRKRAKLIAALALARGLKVSEAAAQASVSERSVYRWLRLPNFAHHVARLRGDMIRAAAGKLADSMAEAADVLRANLTDPEAAVRHRAAAEIVRSAIKVVELAELQRRLEELEQRIGGES